MHQSFFTPNYIFNNDAYFLDFRAQKFPLIFLNVNPFKRQQALHFGVLYETQHKKGTCKVSGRCVVFSAFYADFCLCPKSVIITTLNAICFLFFFMCHTLECFWPHCHMCFFLSGQEFYSAL